MKVSNPRFPHWCRILRKTTEDPMVDENDFSPLDVDFADSDSSSSSSDSGSQTTLVYEGACRSYKINTTSDKGEVITSQRGLSLPLNQDGWDRLGIVPQEGDEIIVVHGDSFKEYGRVLDKSVATASFAGTHLVWRYVRN